MSRTTMVTRNSRSGRAWALAMIALTFTLSGCNEDEALDAFRGAATTNLEAGVNSLLDGVVEGVFAVVELGDDLEETTTEGAAAP